MIMQSQLTKFFESYILIKKRAHSALDIIILVA